MKLKYSCVNFETAEIIKDHKIYPLTAKEFSILQTLYQMQIALLPLMGCVSLSGVMPIMDMKTL